MTSLFFFEWVSLKVVPLTMYWNLFFFHAIRFVYLLLALTIYIYNIYYIYDILTDLSTRTLSSLTWLGFYFGFRYIYILFCIFCIFRIRYTFFALVNFFFISFYLILLLFPLSKQIVHSKNYNGKIARCCIFVVVGRVVLRICRIRFVFSAAQMKLSRFPNAKAKTTTTTTTAKRQQREPSSRPPSRSQRRLSIREIAFESSLRARVSHRYFTYGQSQSQSQSESQFRVSVSSLAHWFAYFENTFAAGVDWIGLKSKGERYIKI